MTINHDRIKLCRDREVPEWIRKARDKLPPDTMADANQFCICRGPDTASFMIQCDECREWYHEKYGGNIRQERGKHYIDYVKRSISAGRLMDPKNLVYDLALLNDGTSHSAICEVIIHQY